MIARMEKVHLVLLEKEKAQGLKALRKLGVIHLEPIAGQGEEHDGAKRRLGEVERALGLLSSVKTAAAQTPQTATLGGMEAARKVNALADEVRSLQEEMVVVSKEIDRVSDLGDFEPGDLAALREAGVPLHLFEGRAALIEEIPEEVTYVRLTGARGLARIAVIGAVSEELAQHFVEIQLPARSSAALRERLRALRERVAAANAGIDGLALCIPAVKAVRDEIVQEVTFEAIRSGMASQGPVAYLAGYVPSKDLPRLRAESASRAWGLLTDDPRPEDVPPTKVENNAVVRMIAPVFQFLGTVPNYREYDISAWFLAFFCLYFAMIFGDGGYGIIMLVAGLIGAVRSKAAGKKVPDALRLLIVLAATTVVWGTATSTFFGIPAARLPAFIRALAVPAIVSGNPQADTNVKIFCFIVGAVQLAAAHLKNIARDFPNPKFLAQVGTLAMVIGMFAAVLNLVIDPIRFPLPTWALAAVGGGFVLVTAFGNWEGNILKSILAGLKGIIPTFLGTVSVFADIVSYIRLWAVGLAGIAISQTVNGMAVAMFGQAAGRILAFAVGALMGILLLGVGHALNVAMSVLSVVVHGVRLNMLEFSGHLGMEWSGYEYDPFRETVREDRSN